MQASSAVRFLKASKVLNGAALKTVSTPFSSGLRAASTVANPVAKFNQAELAKYEAVARVEEDKPSMTLPRERPGLTYSLNWSLSGMGHPPYGEAWRNLEAQALSSRTHGAVENGAVVVDVSNETEVPLYVDVEGGVEEAASWTTKNQGVVAKKFMNEVNDYFSRLGNVYVHDAEATSHTSDKASARIVADNAASALLFNHMLESVALGNAEEFEQKVTVHVAAGFQFEQADIRTEYGAPAIESLGVSAEELVLLLPNKNHAVICGRVNTEVARQAYAYVVGRYVANTFGSLPVAGDMLVKDGAATLILNNTNDVAQVLRSDLLAGAHNLVWSKEGVSRLFRGVSRVQADAKAASSNALVERLAGGKVRVTEPLAKAGPTIARPTNVVILVNDKSGALPLISKLSAEEAVQFFATGLTSVSAEGTAEFHSGFVAPATPARLAELLQTRLTESGASVFVVNSANKDVAKAVLSTTTEALPKTADKIKTAVATKFSQLVPRS